MFWRRLRLRLERANQRLPRSSGPFEIGTMMARIIGRGPGGCPRVTGEDAVARLRSRDGHVGRHVRVARDADSW
jgi:hypothetical protein